MRVASSLCILTVFVGMCKKCQMERKTNGGSEVMLRKLSGMKGKKEHALVGRTFRKSRALGSKRRHVDMYLMSSRHRENKVKEAQSIRNPLSHY